MLELGIKFWLAYALGGVMGALVVGRLRGGVDIRQLGSGNAGGTNALRTQGKLFALAVMVIDVGKGILAVALIPPLDLPGIGIDAAVPRDLLRFSVAFAAILGHVFPLWFDFRGGKGGATAAGLLVFLAPGLGGLIIGLWLAIIFFTGFVGLATISGSVAAAVYVGLFRLPADRGLFWFAVATAVLIAFTHRANISRMRQGTENRTGRFFGLR